MSNNAANMNTNNVNTNSNSIKNAFCNASVTIQLDPRKNGGGSGTNMPPMPQQQHQQYEPSIKRDIRKHYEFKQILGTGAFSEVILARKLNCVGIDSLEQMVAIKCIRRKALKGKEEALQNEISVLTKYVVFFKISIQKVLEFFVGSTLIYVVTSVTATLKGLG
jgi:hypothetical protein